MKKKKAKVTERVMTIDRKDGNLNGVPFIQFLVAMQGLEALNRGMMLTRTATPKSLYGNHIANHWSEVQAN